MKHAVQQAQARSDRNKSLVGFVVADIDYAIPINCVREIVAPMPITDLPHAPQSVPGVADHRGEVITVVDMRRHWGRPPASETLKSKWILVQSGKLSVGLVVDRVIGVFGTSGQRLRRPPAVSGEDARGFLGVIAEGGKITYVLDIQRFGALAEVTQDVHGQENAM